VVLQLWQPRQRHLLRERQTAHRGIRVINKGQTVRGNGGLAGTGFTSALTVMNGVPNSPAVIIRWRGLIEHVIDAAPDHAGGRRRRGTIRAPIDGRFVQKPSFLRQRSFLRVEADISGSPTPKTK